MSNYQKPSISGYNINPPPDDATTGSDNQLFWSKHKQKLADPIKNLVDAINDQCESAFGKLFLYAVTSVTANTTIDETYRDKVIKTSNAITITLLPAATAGDGFAVTFKNSDTSNTLTLGGDSTETIDGSETLSLQAGQSTTLVCDGTNWLSLDSSSATETGDIVQSFKSSKPGYLLLYGQTIGSASSGATAASSIYQSLFEFCWDNFSDSICPVSSGRGASASADFAANKTLTLIDGRGRVLVGRDNMGGASADVVTNDAADALGGKEGAEEHQLTVNEMPNHSHRSGSNYVVSSGGGAQNVRINNAGGNFGETVGGDQPHNNMQPYITVNTFIKY